MKIRTIWNHLGAMDAAFTPYGTRALRFMLATLFMVLTATAQPLPVGSTRFQTTGSEPITVFTYKPAAYAGGPLLVVFHGVNRNAEEYRTFAISMAERFKALVIAPEFDAERFKTERYQRGGLLHKGKPQPREQWTYAIVHRLVAQVRSMERRNDLPYYLIGHSAGAQFLARMAAFSPGEARRIVAANPGSQLFPSRDLPFGYGFGELPPELSSDEVMQAYLAAPLTLLLGTGDTEEDANFDVTPNAMKQGSTRLERGRACFEMAHQLAATRKWAFHWRKVEIKDVGHSAARMFAAREVEAALFSQ